MRLTQPPPQSSVHQDPSPATPLPQADASATKVSPGIDQSIPIASDSSAGALDMIAARLSSLLDIQSQQAKRLAEYDQRLDHLASSANNQEGMQAQMNSIGSAYDTTRRSDPYMQSHDFDRYDRRDPYAPPVSHRYPYSGAYPDAYGNPPRALRTLRPSNPTSQGWYPPRTDRIDKADTPCRVGQPGWLLQSKLPLDRTYDLDLDRIHLTEATFLAFSLFLVFLLYACRNMEFTAPTKILDEYGARKKSSSSSSSSDGKASSGGAAGAEDAAAAPAAK